MKTYTANEELIAILKKNGFVDKSTPLDNQIQRLRFKYRLSSRKELTLYGESIKIFDAGILQENKLVLTEEELRMIILYLKVSRTDSLEFIKEELFKSAAAIVVFNNLEIKLQTEKVLSTKHSKSIKLERMQKVYNEIEL